MANIKSFSLSDRKDEIVTIGVLLESKPSIKLAISGHVGDRLPMPV